MAFEWSEQRVQWYLDASRYGDFHQRLAGAIAPYLLPEDHLCDLGCGLGRLDLKLAPLVEHITCVDIDERVIEHLRQEAAIGGVSNISARCCDASAIGEGFDVVLMAFFGHPPQLMFDCMNMAKRALVRVVNAGPNGAALQPQKHSRPRETTRDIAKALDAANLRYELIQESFEFGQPLKSREEARAFVRCNSPAIQDTELESFLSRNLKTNDSDDFPFYLPGKKELGIFIIFK